MPLCLECVLEEGCVRRKSFRLSARSGNCLTVGCAVSAYLQVGEELATHDGLLQHVQGGGVLEGCDQVHNERAVALCQNPLLPFHVLLDCKAPGITTTSSTGIPTLDEHQIQADLSAQCKLHGYSWGDQKRCLCRLISMVNFGTVWWWAFDRTTSTDFLL